jgi:hypothetical protein
MCIFCRDDGDMIFLTALNGRESFESKMDIKFLSDIFTGAASTCTQEVCIPLRTTPLYLMFV